MENSTGQSSGDIRAAAASAVSPDPGTAALLEKHAAWKQGQGPRPEPSEFGKLGAWIKKITFGKDGPVPGSSQPGASPGDAAALGAGSSGQASGDSLAAVEADPAFVERTTLAVLRRTDTIAARYVGNAARRAGATAEQVARFERAAGMREDDKKLIAELTPDAARAAGIDLRHYPITVLGGVVGLYVCDLYLIVQELKDMEAKRIEAENIKRQEAKSQEVTKATNPPAVAVQPEPTRQKGDPGIIT